MPDSHFWIDFFDHFPVRSVTADVVSDESGMDENSFSSINYENDSGWRRERTNIGNYKIFKLGKTSVYGFFDTVRGLIRGQKKSRGGRRKFHLR